jgi:hypothetical protein
LEKLKICRLYNFDTKEKEIYKNDWLRYKKYGNIKM